MQIAVWADLHPWTELFSQTPQNAPESSGTLNKYEEYCARDCSRRKKGNNISSIHPAQKEASTTHKGLLLCEWEMLLFMRRRNLPANLCTEKNM